MFVFYTNELMIPTRYITVITNCTTNRLVLRQSTAWITQPTLLINKIQMFKGYTLKLVRTTPAISRAVIPHSNQNCQGFRNQSITSCSWLLLSKVPG